jgi:hypothetical protein
MRARLRTAHPPRDRTARDATAPGTHRPRPAHPSFIALAANRSTRPRGCEIDATIADGGPVVVWLGDHELPIGDLGHPRVDAKVLLALLAKDGRAAEVLPEHGLDEAAVRGAPGGP